MSKAGYSRTNALVQAMIALVLGASFLTGGVVVVVQGRRGGAFFLFGVALIFGLGAAFVYPRKSDREE